MTKQFSHCPLAAGILIFGMVALCCLAENPSALAQVGETIEIPSSFNPVGSGARALGMGGAFIAVADDATSASWNPGGLVQLETPEVALVLAHVDRTEDLDFGTNPEASGSQQVSLNNINYFRSIKIYI